MGSKAPFGKRPLGEQTPLPRIPPPPMPLFSFRLAKAKATRIRRNGGLFGGKALELEKLERGAEGNFFRVLLPVFSLEEADSICGAIKDKPPRSRRAVLR